MKQKFFATALGILMILGSFHVTAAMAQTDTTPDFSGTNPHWLEDSNSQCWVYDASSSPPSGLTIAWSGACSSSLATGTGTLSYLINGSVIETDIGKFNHGVEAGLFETQLFDANGNMTQDIKGHVIKGKFVGVANVVIYQGDQTKLIVTWEYNSLGTPRPFGTGTFVDANGNSFPGRWVTEFNQGTPVSTFVRDDGGSNNNQSQTSASSQPSQENDDSAGQDQSQVNQQILGMVVGGIAQSAGQLAQAQRNIAQTHEQVQEELAARNQQAAPAQIYIPSPPVQAPPAVAPSPDQQVTNTGSANNDTVPVAESCISSFYNPNSYNWFTWKDNCSYPVNVYFMLKDGSGINGTDIVNPGDDASGNTGLSQSEVNQGGGYVWGACPQGYGAFDYATNQRWRPSSSQYYCKQTGTGT